MKSLRELDRYRWSGHSVLVGKNRNEWQERAYVLDRFGGGERRAIRGYRKFVEEGISLGRRPELVGGGLIRSLGGWSQVKSLRAKREKEEYDSRILGSGDFVGAIMREADQKLARQLKQKGGKGRIEDVIGKMCKGGGIKEGELRGGGQRRRVSEVRGKIALFLSREMGISMAEIARNLGVGTSAIAMAIRREGRRLN